MSLAQNETVTIDPVGPIIVVEGSNHTINCTDEANHGSALALRENGVLLTGSRAPPSIVTGSVRTFNLLVNGTRNRTTYDCVSGLTGVSSGNNITLTVACKLACMLASGIIIYVFVIYQLDCSCGLYLWCM